MTAAGKITTAALTPGTRILVDVNLATGLAVAYRKRSAAVATVERVDVVPTGGFGRRPARQVITDLGTLTCAPSQTHYLAGGR